MNRLSLVRVAFTGTRKGMTRAQAARVSEILFDGPYVFHHGDAVGADEEAARIARQVGCRLIAHPSTHVAQRAYAPSDEVCDPLPPLKRNEVMVDEADWILAAPAQRIEVRRSGTWATVRYARKVGKLVVFVYPEGDAWRVIEWSVDL